MSENLDLVRSIYAAWERGDYSSVDWADPEIEFVVPDGPTRGHSTGLAAMAESTREYLGAWEDVRFLVDDYRELDGERVLALVHQSGRGKASGLDLAKVGTKRASLFHIRDGKVTRLILYWDGGRALADLGLKE
jgi:ketosteroid isomerase-like protein